MTDYKILGQSAPSTNVETDLYTVPDSKSTVVRAINVTNSSSASDTFDIALIDNISLVETPTHIAIAAPYVDNAQTAGLSTDGITWTATTLPENVGHSSVTFGNNIFIITRGLYFNQSNVSNGVSFPSANIAYISTNGTIWTISTLPGNFVWSSIIYGNGVFTSVTYTANSTVSAVSTNGITWTQGTMPPARWASVTYGDEKFVSVAVYGPPSRSIDKIAAYSTNGIAWTQSTLPVNSMWNSVTYGGGKFVAISGFWSYSAAVAISTDGITWTQGTLPQSRSWFNIEYGNNTFIAVGNWLSASTHETYAASTDGVSWVLRTFPASLYWKSINYGNNIFVAVALNSQISAASTDGITWTQGTLPSVQQWQDVGYGSLQSINYPSTTNSDYIFKSHDILPNETITIKGGYTLDSNNKIRIKSTNGTSTFHAFGGEI